MKESLHHPSYCFGISETIEKRDSKGPCMWPLDMMCAWNLLTLQSVPQILGSKHPCLFIRLLLPSGFYAINHHAEHETGGRKIRVLALAQSWMATWPWGLLLSWILTLPVAHVGMWASLSPSSETSMWTGSVPWTEPWPSMAEEAQWVLHSRTWPGRLSAVPKARLSFMWDAQGGTLILSGHEAHV